MLTLKNITKTFISKKNFHKITAVDQVSLTLEKGVYGLLGPNGSGKTTLLRCITGMYRYTGEILADGQNIKKAPQFTDDVGYLPQQFDMFRELTLFEMLSYFGALRHIPKKDIPQQVDAVLSIVNLTDKRNTKTGALSGGMLRRAGIAQAILGNPPLVILDEPTTGLDVEERLRFKNIIMQIKQDRTILLSTHIIEDVEALCDHIIILHKSKLIFDGTREQVSAKANGKVFEMPADNILQGAEIQKLYDADGVKTARVLSAAPLAAQSVPPTVEDGYLCCIKNL